MKKLFISLALCAAFLTGCETTPVISTPEFVLVGQIGSDSVGLPSSGTTISSRTISSGMLNFTDADSMKIEVTIEGSTNNTNPTPFEISYNTGITTIVYTIPSSSFTTTEQNIVSIIVSPNVSASFSYAIKYDCNDTLGGYAKFRDLKIYKK